MTNTTGDTVTKQNGYPVEQIIDTAQLKIDLAFSSNDLSSAMMQQASMFSHYGVMAAQASRQVDVIKLLLENTEATIDKISRDQMAKAGEKVTEALLDKIICRHDRVIAMKRSLNEARRIENVAKTAMEAFRHRRDMLIQLGLIHRDERKGELVIREKQAAEQARDAMVTSQLARRVKENQE